MSVQKAEEFYRSLTPTQQHFIDKKVIHDTQKVEQWLKFLARAADYDEYTDTMQGRFRKRKGTFMGLGVFTVFISFFGLVAGFPYLFALPILFFVLAASQNRKYKRMKDHDLHDSLRMLFVPLLKVLMVKAGPQAKLSANLNFADPKDGEVEKYKDTRGRDVKKYQAIYILSKVGLQDGALMELVVGDSLFDLSYWKTGSSGKRKFKRKIKTTNQALVKLSAPKSVYRRKESQVGDPSEVSIEETEDTFIIKCKRKYKSQGSNILGADPVLALLHGVYDELERIDGLEPMVEASGDQKPPLPPDVWDREYFDEYDVWGTSYYMHDYDLDDDDHVNIFDS